MELKGDVWRGSGKYLYPERLAVAE